MRFTCREHRWFFGLVILAAFWGLFSIAVNPAIERTDTLKRVLPEKQRILQELRVKASRYISLQAKLDDLKKQTNLEDVGFEILTFLETTTRKEGLTENVKTMKQYISPLDSKYDEIIVEIELEKLTLDRLIKFLIQIKSTSHFLKIKSLYTQQNTANLNLLDTLMHISTLKPNYTNPS